MCAVTCPNKDPERSEMRVVSLLFSIKVGG
jgi:hypothetical protein